MSTTLLTCKAIQLVFIDQFQYMKIQPKTIDLSTRLMGITTEFVGFIPKSLVLKSIVLDQFQYIKIQSIATERAQRVSSNINMI